MTENKAEEQRCLNRVIYFMFICLFIMYVRVCMYVCVCVCVCVCTLYFTKSFCLLVQVMELIDEYNAREKFVAAVIVEPIQAEGGEFVCTIMLMPVPYFTRILDSHFSNFSYLNNLQGYVEGLLSVP